MKAKRKAQENLIALDASPDRYFRMGIRNFEQKRLRRALYYMEKAARQDAYNEEYLFNLAGLYSESGMNRKAIETLKRIIKYVDPSFADCYFGIAVNFYEHGELRHAREYFEKYLRVAPEGDYAHEVREALEMIRESSGMRRSPRRDKLLRRWVQEAREAAAEGAYARAAQKLDRVLDREPMVLSVRNELAVYLFMCEEYKKAFSMAASVLRTDPQNLGALCNLAIFYHYAGQSEECEEVLGHLVQAPVKDESELGQGVKAMMLIDRPELTEQLMESLRRTRGDGETLPEDDLARARARKAMQKENGDN